MKGKKHPKKRVRRNAGDARELIIQTALGCFADKGFYETSFQAIADACGMSQTSVLYHFKTKPDLLKAVLDVILRSNMAVVGRRMEGVSNAKSALRAHFEGNLEWALRHRNESKNILLLYYYGTYSQEFSDLYRGIRHSAVDKIAAIARKAREDGQLSGLVSVDAFALVAHDLLLGSIVNCLAVGGVASAKRQCADSWQQFFRMYFK